MSTDIQIIEEQLAGDPGVEDLKQSLSQAEQIRQFVLEGNISQLEALGFDLELLPIMQMFAESGPKIFGSYSHPTELDLHKIKSSVLITDLCIRAGVNPELVKTVQLDTRDIHNSTKRPLSISDFGVKNQLDVLALNRQSTDTLNAARSIVGVLQSDIDSELSQLNASKGLSKLVRSQIISLLDSRLQELLPLLPVELGLSEEQVNIKMKNFNIALAEMIIPQSNARSLYLRNLGTQTLSEDLEYRSLISGALAKIIEIKGISVIKMLANAEKDQELMRINIAGVSGDIKISPSGVFTLNFAKQKREISDAEFVELMPSGLSLGILESLVLVAGGQTIHVGTDRGASAQAIEILGVKNEAAEILKNNLTFGERHIHGHDGIVVGKNLVPLPLQFLILGAQGVREIITQDEAIRFSDVNEFKKFVVRSLINQVINSEQ